MDPTIIITTLVGLGLAGFAGLALLEKLVPIIPSYAMLMLIGSLASGSSALVAAVAATTVGSVIGAMVWYGLGRALGSERVEGLVGRYGRFVFLKPDVYARLCASYRQNQFWATLLGQTIPTARVYLALPAGVLGLKLPTFVVATTLGTLAWNTPFVVVGYHLGGEASQLGTIALVVVGLLVAEILIAMLVKHVRQRRAGRRAEACDNAPAVPRAALP
jgi:membrane protein DedA with SNARE-associated domain